VLAGLGNAVQTSRKREADLQAAIEAQNQRLLALKDWRIEMAGMTRDIEAAQRSYDAVLARYMPTRSTRARRAPTPCCSRRRSEPLKPVHPKLGLIAGLSLVLGTLLARGIVYVLEMLDRRVRSRQDLESRLRRAVARPAFQVAAHGRPAVAGADACCSCPSPALVGDQHARQAD
jgi:uncharacterized protein involved in exopolysaccharide biosynthesis